MFYDKYVELCEQKGVSPSFAATEIGIDKSTVSYWKRKGFAPRLEVQMKIAEYFNVSIDYLLGNEADKAIQVTDNDIKFALFGSTEISDEAYEEVKRFAEFVQQRGKNGTK